MKLFNDGKKLTVFVLAMITAVSAAALFWQKASSGGSGLSAVISIDGREVRAIPLSEEGEPFELHLNDQFGVDIVLECEDGKIRFKTSDCPDKVCINSGWLSRDMDIAVCMPNRTSVVVMPSGQTSAPR